MTTNSGAGFSDALGRTIQVLRTDRGVDRKDLAEKAQISYSYLSAIESGKKQASSAVLRRIAHALELRSHELFASAEHRVEQSTNIHGSPRGWFQPEPVPSGGTPPDPASLFKAIESLSPADQELVATLVRRLGSR